MNRRHFLSLTTAAAFAAVIVLGACGDDSGDADATPGTSAEATTDAITIDGAWARTSPMMAGTGAAYFTITSSVDDVLLGASVDPAIAGSIQLHETKMATATTMTGDSAMTGDSMAPMMEMAPVDRITLPAGSPVALAPGGLHLMLLDLQAPLEAGQTFTLTVTLDEAGTRDVQVTVRDDAP